jgi:hypothetical protein
MDLAEGSMKIYKVMIKLGAALLALTVAALIMVAVSRHDRGGLQTGRQDAPIDCGN